jgi:uncharacterized protein with HEPN domain
VTRDCRDYLQDILESIDESAAFTAGLTLRLFHGQENRQCVVRSLEVLGEAPSGFPKASKENRQ